MEATQQTHEISANQLSQSLGIRIHDLRLETISSGGFHSRIYACQSEIGDLVLRICKDRQGYYTQYFPDAMDPGDWMDNMWAIQKARSAGVPAPEILHSDRAERWVVMKRLPGTPIDSEYELWDRCPYDEREFGLLLGRMHAIEPSGFGPIDDWGRTCFSSWRAFLLKAAASTLSTCLARNSMPQILAKQLQERWFPHLDGIDLGRPSLLHLESLGFANILYSPETRTITGLLDYEDCIAGDPLFEICWMKFYFEHDSQDQPYFDFKRFSRGYGALEFDAEKLSLYSPFPLLDKLRWIEPGCSRAQEYIHRLEGFVKRC